MNDSSIILIPQSYLIYIAGVVSLISSLGAPLVPMLASVYHIRADEAQWSLTIALISAAISTPILAKLASGGRYKSTMMAALSIALLGCVTTAMASQYPIFLFGRFLQGIAMGIVPSLMAFSSKGVANPSKTISILSVTTGIGVGLGYPVTGFLATYLGLKFTFSFGGFVIFIALIVANKLYDRPNDEKKGFDYRGACFMSVCMLSLITIIGGMKEGWTIICSGIVVFLLSLWGWLKFGEQAVDPLIHPEVLKMKLTTETNAIMVLTGMIMYLLISANMFYVQQRFPPGLGLNSCMASLFLVPLSACTLLSRFLGLGHLDAYQRARAGAYSLLIAMLLFCLNDTVYLEKLLAMGCCGYGVGLIFSSVPQMVRARLRGKHEAAVYGVNQISKSLGFSIGSAMAANILHSIFIGAYDEPTQLAYVWTGVAGAGLALVLIWVLTTGRRRLV